MKPYVKLDVKEVKEFLLEIALIKSVFIWGHQVLVKVQL